MSPEEQAIDIEARQKQVAEILATPADKPVRAPRSDKGTKRPPKPAAAPVQAAGITDEQAQTWRGLLKARDSAAIIMGEAHAKFVSADEALNDFNASLTAQGK